MVTSKRVSSSTSHWKLSADHRLPASYVPLPKSSKPERIVSNADVYDFELSQEDMSALDALDKGDAGAISWNPVNAEWGRKGNLNVVYIRVSDRKEVVKYVST